MTNNTKQAKVGHFEIPADDTKRAREFYEKTFGWNTVEWPMPGGSTYIGLHTGPSDPQTFQPTTPGYINGGMFQRGGNFAAKGVVITPIVEDINETIELVKANGGKVLAEPQTIPDMGIYAYIEDAEGNCIGLWQELKKPSE